MTRRLAVIAAAVAVVIVAELAAPTVIASQLERGLRRRCAFEDIELVSISRPVLPRLLVGRARDVSVRVTGLELEEVRLAELRLDATSVALGWWPTADPAVTGDLDLVVGAEDLEAALEDASFGLWHPEVLIDGEGIRVGDDRTEVSVPLSLDVDDGQLRIAPGPGQPGWWDLIGLTEAVQMPEGVEVLAVDFRPGEVLGTLGLDLVLDDEERDGDGCTI